MKTKELEATLQWAEVHKTPILKLWEDPDQYPQMVVMTVSHAEYLKFSKDPIGFMKFVNDYDVFSKPVIFAGPWISLSPVHPEDHPLEWVLIVMHGKKSTMVVAALAKLNVEDQTSDWVSWCGLRKTAA